MPTSAEIRQSIERAFAAYMAELEQAAAVWERKPAGATEGEDAWCARQVAEHIASSGPFFGAAIAAAIGVPGPTPERVTFSDFASSLDGTRQRQQLLMDVVAHLSDAQVSLEIEHPRLGKNTVGGLLGIVTHHLNDHAGQLKSLRG